MYNSSQKEAMELLSKAGAVITDSHIVYTKGGHGSTYIDKDLIFMHPIVTEILCDKLARLVEMRQSVIEAVIGPSMGGIGFALILAFHLYSKDLPVIAAYAEKQKDGNFKIRPSFAKAIRGKHVLVSEDILNTGGSAHAVIKTVQEAGGIIAGVAAIVNRGGVTCDQLGNVPFVVSVVNIDLDNYPAEKCPYCKRGIPINTDVGHGQYYLAHQQVLTSLI